MTNETLDFLLARDVSNRDHSTDGVYSQSDSTTAAATTATDSPIGAG